MKHPTALVPTGALTSGTDQVLILQNPTAGRQNRQQRVQKLQQELHQLGLETTCFSDIHALTAKAEQAQSNGTLRAVVAAGGDGTVGLVINHLPAGIPISVLPLGTENLLARSFDIQPENAAQVIHRGTFVRLDAGEANGRLFLLMFSCGLDSDIVERLHKRRQGHISHWSYFRPILASIRSYRYPEVRVYFEHGGDSESTTREVAARWVFVNNLPIYALKIPIVPQAIGTDGVLDLCTLRRGSLPAALWYLAGILLRRHQRWKDCTTAKVTTVRVESDHPVAFQLDGDPGGQLPVHIQVHRQRVTLLIPAATTATS
ncbi:MAG: diacylglycerol kinase family protein [Planctomycetota bacterium]|nr:diacylglycerol kinase family protein [Planctomycetota bacterium]